jgi:TatD DNase family protein
MNYFDTHSHLHDKAFDLDRDTVISEMEKSGIGTIAIGTDEKESKSAVALASNHSHIYASVGLHPADNVLEKFNYDLYKTLAGNPKVIAIGECGLDYFYIENFFKRDQLSKGITHSEGTEKERQKSIFQEHINLAYELHKPLMLHIRASKGSIDAYTDAIEMLRTQIESGKPVTGNVHFFTGTVEVAKQFLELGFTISFPGVITFTKEYDDVVKMVPLEMIHSETDSPYAAPLPYRGQRNSPLCVEEIVKKIAELKELDTETVRLQLLSNAKRVFGV